MVQRSRRIVSSRETEDPNKPLLQKDQSVRKVKQVVG